MEISKVLEDFALPAILFSEGSSRELSGNNSQEPVNSGNSENSVNSGNAGNFSKSRQDLLDELPSNSYEFAALKLVHLQHQLEALLVPLPTAPQHENLKPNPQELGENLLEQKLLLKQCEEAKLSGYPSSSSSLSRKMYAKDSSSMHKGDNRKFQGNTQNENSSIAELIDVKTLRVRYLVLRASIELVLKFDSDQLFPQKSSSKKDGKEGSRIGVDIGHESPAIRQLSEEFGINLKIPDPPAKSSNNAIGGTQPESDSDSESKSKLESKSKSESGSVSTLPSSISEKALSTGQLIVEQLEKMHRNTGSSWKTHFNNLVLAPLTSWICAVLSNVVVAPSSSATRRIFRGSRTSSRDGIYNAIPLAYAESFFDNDQPLFKRAVTLCSELVTFDQARADHTSNDICSKKMRLRDLVSWITSNAALATETAALVPNIHFLIIADMQNGRNLRNKNTDNILANFNTTWGTALDAGQLEACASIEPRVLTQQNFVNAFLVRDGPKGETNLRADLNTLDGLLSNLEKELEQLDEKFQTAELMVLFHRLQTQRKKEPPKIGKEYVPSQQLLDLFCKYISIPRHHWNKALRSHSKSNDRKKSGGSSSSSSSSKSVFSVVSDTATQAKNFARMGKKKLDKDDAMSAFLRASSFKRTVHRAGGAIWEPSRGEDDELVTIMLTELFASGKNLSDVFALVEEKIPSHMITDAKVESGVMESDDEATSNSSKGPLLQLCDFNPTYLTSGAASTNAETTELAVDVKNLHSKTLHVKAYEIDTRNVLLSKGKEVGTSLNLDGLVPNLLNETVELDPQIPKWRRNRIHVRLPEVSARPYGVFVVDVISSGISSRALLRKGNLVCVQRPEAIGHVFQVFDADTHEPIPNHHLSLEFKGRTFLPDLTGDGQLVIPFASPSDSTAAGSRSQPQTAGSAQLIISMKVGRPNSDSMSTFSCSSKFERLPEKYSLEAGLFIDRESLTAGNRHATVLARPVLTMFGGRNSLDPCLAPLRRFAPNSVTIEVSLKNEDGIESKESFSISEQELVDADSTRELQREFTVTPNLRRVVAKMCGEVQLLSSGQRIQVQDEISLEINSAERSGSVLSNSFLRNTCHGFQITNLGKNAELPSNGTSMDLSFTHVFLKEPIVHAVMTNRANTAIDIGRLFACPASTKETVSQSQRRDISEIFVSSGSSSHSSYASSGGSSSTTSPPPASRFKVPSNHCLIPSMEAVRHGETLSIPLPYINSDLVSEDATASDATLLEVRPRIANLFGARSRSLSSEHTRRKLEGSNHMKLSAKRTHLIVTDLPPGNYELYLGPTLCNQCSGAATKIDILCLGSKRVLSRSASLKDRHRLSPVISSAVLNLSSSKLRIQVDSAASRQQDQSKESSSKGLSSKGSRSKHVPSTSESSRGMGFSSLRVHVILRHFGLRIFKRQTELNVPSIFSSFTNSRSKVLNKGIKVTTLEPRESQQISGRQLGDEVLYVMERKRKRETEGFYPGNMLPRPSLLINPQDQGTTTTTTLAGKEGEQFAEVAPAGGGGDDELSSSIMSMYGCNSMMMQQQQQQQQNMSYSSRKLASAGTESEREMDPAVDFIQAPSQLLANLVPNEQGELEIDIGETLSRQGMPKDDAEKVWHWMKQEQHIVEILVVDKAGDCFSTVASVDNGKKPAEKSDPARNTVNYRDIRYISPFPLESHIREVQSIACLLGQDQTEFYSCGPEATSSVCVIDSIPEMMELMQSNKTQLDLRKWSFLKDWHTMSAAAKIVKHDAFACHELNFFIHQHDPEFFIEVVKPELLCKANKSLVDRWLVGESLEELANPVDLKFCNPFELCLILSTLGDNPEKKHVIAQHLRRSHDNDPENQELTLLFKTAFQFALSSDDAADMAAATDKARRDAENGRGGGGEGEGESEREESATSSSDTSSGDMDEGGGGGGGGAGTSGAHPPPPPLASDFGGMNFAAAPKPPVFESISSGAIYDSLSNAAVSRSRTSSMKKAPKAKLMTSMLSQAGSLGGEVEEEEEAEEEKEKDDEEESEDDRLSEQETNNPFDEDQDDSRDNGSGWDGEKGSDDEDWIAERLTKKRSGEDHEKFYTDPGASHKWTEQFYWDVGVAFSLFDCYQFWADFAHYLATAEQQRHQQPGSGFLSGKCYPSTVNEALLILGALTGFSEDFRSGGKGHASNARHEWHFDKAEMKLKPARSAVVYNEQLKKEDEEESSSSPETDQSVIVNQIVFDQDRVNNSNNDGDVFPADEVVCRFIYGCRVVMSNLSGRAKSLKVICGIPNGARPLGTSKTSFARNVRLAAYETWREDYFFYFPQPGTYTMYPVHVGKFPTGELIAFSAPQTLQVVEALTSIDMSSWSHVSTWGTLEQVTSHLREAEDLRELNLSWIAWRLKDRASYESIMDTLERRFFFSSDIWKYSVVHNDVKRIRQLLRSNRGICRAVGPRLSCPLLEIDDAKVSLARWNPFIHVEIFPLINARAFVLGSRENRALENVDLAHKVNEMLKRLAFRPEKGASYNEKLIYLIFLLAQDRVSESLQLYDLLFGRVSIPRDLYSFSSSSSSSSPSPSSSSSSSSSSGSSPSVSDIKGMEPIMQRHYLEAYLCFYSVDSKDWQHAWDIAEHYASGCKNRKWNAKFKDVLSQLKEVKQFYGGTARSPDTSERDQTRPAIASEIDANELNESDANESIRRNEKGASSSEELDCEVAPDETHLVAHVANVEPVNAKGARVRVYEMDIELLFSTSPFEAGAEKSMRTSSSMGQFGVVVPNATIPFTVPEACTAREGVEVQIPIPDELVNRNLMIETQVSKLTRWTPWFSTALRVTLHENFAEIKVVNKQSRQPLPGVYVKVYAKISQTPWNAGQQQQQQQQQQQRQGKKQMNNNYGSSSISNSGLGRTVQFWKDGFTDLRGRFCYASLNTNEINKVLKFSIFVDSKEYGSTILKADPPLLS